MMIVEEIKTLEELKSKYESKEREVFRLCNSVLKKIYNLQTEYNKKNRKRLYLIEEGFDKFATDHCKAGDLIEVNYYDTAYDCYDAAQIELPQEVFEDDNKLQEWFDLKVSEYEEGIKKAKQQKEDAEYQNYLKLKEKYEN